jgi:hypothetical protein
MIGFGTSYNHDNFGAQFCIPRNASNPILSVRYRESIGWVGWFGIAAEALTIGNKTMSGNLIVNNITLSSTGKINCVDDNHYIQLDQTHDMLTLQEYGTISFNIGPSKAQKMHINSSDVVMGNNLKFSVLLIFILLVHMQYQILLWHMVH